METILVIGAAGHAGCLVARELLSRGYQVKVIFSSKKPAFDSASVEYVQGDATKLEDIRAAVEGVSSVINCIGFGKGNGKPTDFFSRANKTLLGAMKESGAVELITMSNVGVSKTGNRLVYGFVVTLFMKWLKHIMDDKERMEADLHAEKQIRWAVARFPNIVAGELLPIKTDFDGKSVSLSITVPSVAKVLVDLLADKEVRFKYPCFSN